MKKFNTIWLLGISLLCALFQVAQAQSLDKKIIVSSDAQFNLDEKITKLKLVDKRQTVIVEISTARSIEAKSLPNQPKFSGLTISKIAISVDGQNILVPKSAVDYLVDVNRCSIKRNRNGWALSIDGRDGAYGYMAVIYFDRRQVHRRAIYSDVNQSRLTEEIRYMPPEIIN